MPKHPAIAISIFPSGKSRALLRRPPSWVTSLSAARNILHQPLRFLPMTSIGCVPGIFRVGGRGSSFGPHVMFLRNDVTLCKESAGVALFGVCASFLHIDIAMAHAPHSDRPAVERSELWKEFGRALTLRRRAHDYALLLCIGANASCGSVTLACVWDRYPSEENNKGRFLHHLLRAHCGFSFQL